MVKPSCIANRTRSRFPLRERGRSVLDSGGIVDIESDEESEPYLAGLQSKGKGRERKRSTFRGSDPEVVFLGEFGPDEVKEDNVVEIDEHDGSKGEKDGLLGSNVVYLSSDDDISSDWEEFGNETLRNETGETEVDVSGNNYDFDSDCFSSSDTEEDDADDTDYVEDESQTGDDDSISDDDDVDEDSESSVGTESSIESRKRRKVGGKKEKKSIGLKSEKSKYFDVMNEKSPLTENVNMDRPILEEVMDKVETESSGICRKNGNVNDDCSAEELCREKTSETVRMSFSRSKNKEEGEEKQNEEGDSLSALKKTGFSKNSIRTARIECMDAELPNGEDCRVVKRSTSLSKGGAEKDRCHIRRNSKTDAELPSVAFRKKQKMDHLPAKLSERVLDKKEEEEETGKDEAGKGRSHNERKGEEEKNRCRIQKKYTGITGKQASRRKDINLFQLLSDSIWGRGNGSKEDLFSLEEVVYQQESNPPEAAKSFSEKIPDTFPFEIDFKTIPVEKTDEEKELDMLWGLCELGIKSGDIGSFTPAVENEAEDDTAGVFFCRGEHSLTLDEEIGIYCKFCSYVHLEIQYVLPPLEKYSSGGLEKKLSTEGDGPLFNGVQFPDSGSCSQDFCNLSGGTVWDIIPHIKKTMYPHQQEGFEFIWTNIAGSIDLDKLKSVNPNNAGDPDCGGCIISHAPGTGKTRLTIVFLRTYLELYPESRPVIIAPASLLLTWADEFKKWDIGVPFHNLNNLELSGKEGLADNKILDICKNQNQKKNIIRMVKLFSWKKRKSILGISYNLYEKLAGDKFEVDKETKKNKKILLVGEHEEMKKILRELPGLLVLDEGHTPRNQRSRIWKLLLEIKTEKRIILTGTPFQNSFLELYNTLCLVRPSFPDKISPSLKKFCQRRLTQEREGVRSKQASLGNSTGKDADHEIESLKSLMASFVNVHKGSILQKNLPGLRDCVVILNPEKLQKKLLEGIQGSQNTFQFEHKLALVSVHPSLFLCCSLSDQEESEVKPDELEKIILNPNEGVKTRFLMELIRLCEAVNEKVLVFSQFIDPLSLIVKQLNSFFSWTEGKEVLNMHGKIDQKQRQSLLYAFNDPNSQAKILLASTKACSEGISLVGASRVVLLDVVWNPSVERQAISRAYRLGQTKVVYTYHLITQGTTECAKYCKQAEKDRISELVFSSKHNENDKAKGSAAVTDDQVLDEMVCHDNLKDMFEKIIYQPKEQDLFENFGL